MHHEHPAPFGPRWRARWIWFERPRIRTQTATRPVLDEPADRIGLFRRVLELDDVPGTVPLRMWSDGRHVLWVNGVEVLRGPVRSDPRRARYDVVDVAPHLRPGRNVLAVLARHFAAATSWWAPVPPTYSLGAGSLALEALVGDDWVVSDASWWCRPGVAWTAVPVPGDVAALPLESFDAREHPWGWQTVERAVGLDHGRSDDRQDNGPEGGAGGEGADGAAWVPAVEVVPLHTGAHGDPSPPSEPFGMLLPPVRVLLPTGEERVATEVARRPSAGSPPVADPVRQVLADEATVGDEPDTAGSSVQDQDGAGSSRGQVHGTAGATGTTVELRSFDLGRIAAGTLVVEVDGAAPGDVVDVAAAEHLDDRGDLVPLGQHAGVRYVCAGDGTEAFESLETIGTRHLHVAVRSSRSPELRLRIRERHRPRPAGAAFSCSDPLLEEIHRVGLRTVDLCALDAYVDCPTREQRAWTGDSVVHQMVDLVSNPDWSMAIWQPQLAAEPRADGMLAMAPASDFSADDRTFVPDWSLHWVRSVHNLYRWTGDRDLVAELLPVAERALRWFESYLGADGLLHDVSGWVLIDWASVYSDGCSSALNALWARALEDLGEMADRLGNAHTAAWARRRREGVAAAFDVFWDAGRSVYVDHLRDGVAGRAAAQHGGAAALAAGLVPPDRVDAVVARLTDRDRLLRHSWVMDTVTPTGGSTGFVHMVMGYPEPTWDVEEQMVAAEPFFRYVLHDGLARAGRADLVEDQCRDWSVFLDAGETTWPECWNGGTRCHGWSSTPTRDLVVHTLGISPGSPGFDSVRVAPALGTLDHAAATVPSPHGPITVEASADGTVVVDSPVPVECPVPFREVRGASDMP